MKKATYAWGAEMTDTNDFSFTSGDLEKLLEELSKIAVKLPKGQWGLLLSIFAAAAGGFKISQNQAGEKEGTFSGVKVNDGVINDPQGKNSRELSDQLRGAYIPGRVPFHRGDNMGIGMITPPQGVGGH